MAAFTEGRGAENVAQFTLVFPSGRGGRGPAKGGPLSLICFKTGNQSEPEPRVNMSYDSRHGKPAALSTFPTGARQVCSFTIDGTHLVTRRATFYLSFETEGKSQPSILH